MMKIYAIVLYQLYKRLSTLSTVSKHHLVNNRRNLSFLTAVGYNDVPDAAAYAGEENYLGSME